MKSNNQYIFPLLTGVLAGAAAIYFLKSEKGQKVVESALSKGASIKETIADNSQIILDKGAKAINEVIEKSKEGMANAVGEVAEITEGKIAEFSEGVQKAKNKLNEVKT